MSSDSKIDSVARSAARLRLAVFVTMGAMVLLYIVSIGIAWFFHRKRMTQEEHDAMEEAAGG